MRVVIVQPSIEDFYSTPHRLSALGGFSVMGVLEKHGHHVSLINFPLEYSKPKTLPLPSYASHLKGHLINEKGPLTYFSQWKRWGPSSEDCARIIGEREPDLVLISLFAWAYGEEVLNLAEAIKKEELPSSPSVFVGGAGISVRTSSYLTSPYIDLVLAGEGEIIFNEQSLDELIKLSREGQGLIKSDKFCSPQEMVPLFSVTTSGKKHIQVATLLSRGCPRKCKFCSNHLTQGRSLRLIPLDKLEASFSRWLMNSQLPHDKSVTLDLEDDNLLMNKAYFKEAILLFRRIWREKKRSGTLFFTAENGMDYDLLDSEMLSFLTENGFRQFNFSLATASRGLVEQENRFFAPQKLSEHLRYLNKKSIPCITYFICGLRGDSRESISEALTTLYKLPTQVGISLFYPVPGLVGFTTEEDFMGKSQGLARGSLAFPWNGSLSTEVMITAFRLSRFLNLCKTPHAAEHRELIELVCKEKTLYTYNHQRKKIPVPNQDRELIEMVLGTILQENLSIHKTI